MAISSEQSESISVAFDTDREQLLWVAAVVFFGIGDLVTTSIGIQVSHVAETGTIQEPLLRQFGLISVPGLKLAVFAGFFACWRFIPSPHNLGVPLALTTVGTVVTVWNLLVILGPVL